MTQIPVAGPWITELEVSLVADAARNDWYEAAGHYVSEFERAFAQYVGRRYAVSLPSCTSAIHLALAALDIQAGDEVIVPEATWIATAAPIVYRGALPVFADIDERTWCLSADSVASCISARTRAIIPVDLYGGMPEMNRLTEIARSHGIAIIEDAAEAIGSEFQGKKAGSFGDMSVFSFHGSKTLTTGEGGMLVTDREDVLQRVLVLRDHGRQPGDVSFFNSEVAYKYKMSSLQAALGLGQLRRIDELVQRKRHIYSWYAKHLSGASAVTLNAEPTGTFNSFWMTTAIVDAKCGRSGSEVQQRLRDRGIATRPFFHPLSQLPAFAGLSSTRDAQVRNRVAYDICGRGVNLPSPLTLNEGQARQVANELLAIIG